MVDCQLVLVDLADEFALLPAVINRAITTTNPVSGITMTAGLSPPVAIKVTHMTMVANPAA